MDLPPDASLADIESERVFREVLLQTLDVDSDNFLSMKSQYEGELETIDAMLAERHAASHDRQEAPTTPSGQGSSYMVNGSRSTSTFPSRTAASVPDWGQSNQSPSRKPTASTENNHLPVGGGQGLSNTSASLNKRPRELSSLVRPSDPDTRHKSRRTSESTSASRSSTPASLDSLDDSEATFGTGVRTTLNLANQAYREKMKQKQQQRQREAEERWKAIRDDEAFARMLSQRSPSPPSASASSNRPLNYQATFGNDASFGRPQYSQSSQPQARLMESKIAALQRIKSEADQNYVSRSTSNQNLASATSQLNGDSRSGISSRTDATPNLSNRRQANTHATPGQGDEDLQVISPQEWAESSSDIRRRRHQQFLQRNGGLPTSNAIVSPVQPVGRSAFPTTSNLNTLSMPGAFPTMQSNNHGFGSANDHDMLHMHTNRPTVLGISNLLGSNAQSSSSHGLPGSSVFGYGSETLDVDSDDDSSAGLDDQFSAQHLEQMRRSGLEHLMEDSAKTKADIVALLDNIRPDEELAPDQKVDPPPGLNCTLMPHQQLGYAWLKKQEEGSNQGSILADDMGLGKTIQAIALMLGRRSRNAARKTTLIVAPLALMRQWKNEISNRIHATHKFTVHTHHGPSTHSAKNDYYRLAQKDVVLTTYGTLAAEWKRKTEWDLKRRANPNAPPRSTRLPLLGDESRWYRVILDEAQGIKSKSTKTAAAAWNLNAQYRLCMTGTPMMNNVEELFPLLKFLRISPYNEWTKFSHDFAGPLKTGKSSRTTSAMRKLQTVLTATLLRRTKTSRIDDQPILSLPPKTIEIEHVVFDEDQMSFYRSLETQTQLEFNKYLAAGTVGKNYSNVLVLLLRLRQCCDHPHLIKDHSVEVQVSPDDQEALAQQFSNDAVAMIRDANGAFDCPICYDASENPIIFFPCGHDVCGECFARLTDPSNAAIVGQDSLSVKCPECRKTIDVKKIISYNIFKKVRLPELCEDEDEHVLKGQVQKEEEEEDDSDTEDEDDDSDDDDDDIDEQGNLDGFIVADDEESEAAASTDDDDDLDAPIIKNRAAQKADEAEEKKLKTDFEGEIKNESKDDIKEDIKEDIKDEESGSDIESREARRTRAKGKLPANSKMRTTAKAKFKVKAKSKSKGKGKAKAKKPKKKTLADLKRESQRNASAKRKYLRRLRKTWVTSAKIEKTLELLATIRANDPSEKTIIFSQFTTFLDLLEVPLEDRQWVSTRYDGSMTAKAREQAVDRFQCDDDCNVMLVSLKAGNAGLNLNWASQVIILDPFWNPYVEDQAVDRAHRIGQVRPVTVHRVLVPETVEDRILQLQDQKRELISSALDENASKDIARLGVRQLAYLFGVGASGAAPPPPE